MSRVSFDNSSPLIHAHDLCKSYKSGHGRIYPLKNVSISLHAGEFVAIMGPSGVGKSTLLHILGCLDRPDSGTYWLDGRDVSSLDDHDTSLLRATKIGFVFQSYNLLPQCTLMENVAMPFMYGKKTPGDSLARAEKAIEEVGLSERLTHRPSELSGGEVQRAAIARALVIDPLVVLADEPTGNLDRENTEAILNLFKKIHQRGTSLLVVTHNQDVARSADRILHITDGLISERV